MNQLVVLIGLPRSGKTTMAKKLQEEGYTRVCPDDFRLAIHGKRFVESAEPFVWAAVYTCVDALMLSGNKVVVDATNISKKRQEPWRVRGAQFIFVSTSADTCIQRALRSGDDEIIPIIKKMAEEMEIPKEKECLRN